ncbi:hypothetical protein KWV16_10060 [Clostridioides difficile]|nr:hypothetical protein [Clostridioides difficile]
MIIRNKLSWNSIEEVSRDFSSCLYNLQNFKILYTKEETLVRSNFLWIT